MSTSGNGLGMSKISHPFLNGYPEFGFCSKNFVRYVMFSDQYVCKYNGNNGEMSIDVLLKGPAHGKNENLFFSKLLLNGVSLG